MKGRELETARLRLRPCAEEDLGLVHALWTDESVRRFLFDGRAIGLDEARSFVAASLKGFERHGYGLWLALARESGRVVGFAGFLSSEEEGVPLLIYGVHPDFWGDGYATEAAGAVLRYALDALAVPKVTADVDEPNAASVRVLEKLGMRRVRRALVGGRPLLYFARARGDA